MPGLGLDGDAYVTLIEIIQATGKTESEILGQIDVQGLLPVMIYPREIIHRIIHEPKPVPSAGSWKTKNQLSKSVGRHNDWIVRKLEEGEFRARKRRNHLGHIVDCYSPAAEYYLKKEANRYRRAGDWVTIYQIEVAIGKDGRWVRRNVRQLGILAQTRLDVRNRPQRHYPPDSIDRLRQLLD